MSEIIFWLSIWWLAGLNTMIYLYWQGWRQGDNVTVHDLLLGIPWSFAGPLILLVIGYLKLRLLDWSRVHAILNKPVIKGKKK